MYEAKVVIYQAFTNTYVVVLHLIPTSFVRMLHVPNSHMYHEICTIALSSDNTATDSF